MKHGMKPNRSEKQILQKWNLKPEDWLIVKHTPEVMEVVYRFSDATKRRIPLR